MVFDEVIVILRRNYSVAMRLVRPSAPFVADSRCAGLFEIVGLTYDTQKNGVDPWSVPSDSDDKVWWKSSVGPNLFASPKRVLSFAKRFKL
jgi:hypothetical protein